MRTFGLIGRSLQHSFSPAYFAAKFQLEQIEDCNYELFELEAISEFPELVKKLGESFGGLNVTIPYKQSVIEYLDQIDEAATSIGAVNTISLKDGKLYGSNTDWIGFKNMLLPSLEPSYRTALILGNGGSAKAIRYALSDLFVKSITVSRAGPDANAGDLANEPRIISYEDLNPDLLSRFDIIINTTPLGMYPEVEQAPDIPYKALHSGQLCVELIYNPAQTLFLHKAAARNAGCLNGQQMLELQAEASWEIWNRV